MNWRRPIDLASFDPETVQLLADAVDAAMALVERRGQVVDADGCRLAIAKHVVELAKEGERDLKVLISAGADLFTP